jgi:hypothetical protein
MRPCYTAGMATTERALNAAQATRAAHRIASMILDEAIDTGSRVIENGMEGYSEAAQLKVRETLADMVTYHDHKSV